MFALSPPRSHLPVVIARPFIDAMFMENTHSVKPAHPEIRRGRVPQTAWRIETVSRLPTAPQLPVDTIFFTHKNQTNGCGVPLRDLIACPPRQVDETIGENMAGGSDEVFAAVEYKSITINVQWPSYDFVYNENVPIANRGKYITRAQLAVRIGRKIQSLVEALRTVLPDERGAYWTIGDEAFGTEDIYVVSLSQLHGRIFRVDLDVDAR